MKFLCIGCDEVMAFSERQVPGDGTFAAAFTCAKCGHEIAMLANPMESQLVASMGVKIGGRTLDEQPMEIVRTTLADGNASAFDARTDMRVVWSADAQTRLSVVPSFVRGMVKRIYTDYAKEHGIAEITPAIMDRARTELGLEGM